MAVRSFAYSASVSLPVEEVWAAGAGAACAGAGAGFGAGAAWSACASRLVGAEFRP